MLPTSSAAPKQEVNFFEDNKEALSRDQTPATQTAEKVHCLYHIRSDKFIGDTIFPLTELKDKEGFEEVYKLQASKYKGREEICEWQVRGFDEAVLWNDVVFLCPIHPHKIYKALQSAGIDETSFNFFQIPASTLIGKQVTVFNCSIKENFRNSVDQYSTFNPFSYEELEEVPQGTRDHYKKEAARKNYFPLLFLDIPHVMVKGPVDVSNARVIDWLNDPNMREILTSSKDEEGIA